MAEIVIMDGDEAASRALAETLALDGHDSYIETTIEGALARAADAAVRVAILQFDNAVRGRDGEALRRLRAGLRGSILALVRTSAETDIVLALHFGADDCMSRPVRTLEFLARVQALLRRARLPESEARTIRVGNVLIDRAARKVERGGHAIALSPCEYRLLEVLAIRRGAAVSRRELLTEVWNRAVPDDSRTIDIHVAQLRKKLEPVPAQPQLIETVWRYGYRIRVEG